MSSCMCYFRHMFLNWRSLPSVRFWLKRGKCVVWSFISIYNTWLDGFLNYAQIWSRYSHTVWRFREQQCFPTSGEISQSLLDFQWRHPRLVSEKVVLYDVVVCVVSRTWLLGLLNAICSTENCTFQKLCHLGLNDYFGWGLWWDWRCWEGAADWTLGFDQISRVCWRLFQVLARECFSVQCALKSLHRPNAVLRRATHCFEFK